MVILRVDILVDRDPPPHPPPSHIMGGLTASEDDDIASNNISTIIATKQCVHFFLDISPNSSPPPNYLGWTYWFRYRVEIQE